MLAEALLDAEARIGVILGHLPSPEGSKIGERGVSKSLPPGITKKQSHYFQQMARYPEIVEQVKAEAREEDDLATRTEDYHSSGRGTMKRIDSSVESSKMN